MIEIQSAHCQMANRIIIIIVGSLFSGLFKGSIGPGQEVSENLTGRNGAGSGSFRKISRVESGQEIFQI